MPRVPPALALTALLVVAGCTGPVATNPTSETEPPKSRELSDIGSTVSVRRNGTLYRVTVRTVME